MSTDPMRDAVIEALNPLWRTGRPETQAEVRKLGEAAGVPKCRCSGVYNCDPWDYPAREALAAHPDTQKGVLVEDGADGEPTAVGALSELAQRDIYPSIHLRRPMNGHPWRARIGYHTGWRGPECEGATPAEAISAALKAAHRAAPTREATDA